MPDHDTTSGLEPTPADQARYVEVDFDPFAGAQIQSVIPTTEAQREVWLADQLDPIASLAFNESVTVAFRGKLDGPAMQRAISALVQRHDILGAVLGQDGTELVIQENQESPLEFEDLTQISSAQADTMLSTFLATESATPFDLVSGPLFRARLISLAEDEHALIIGAHHIVCDGFSFGILLRELASLYRRQISNQPAESVANELPPADQFADYAAQLAAEQASNEASDEDEQYWLGQYQESLPPSLNLPTRQARPGSRSFASARLDLAIKAEQVSQIRQLASEAKSGVFAVLLTGFATLLARLSGQDDLVVGIPSAGQSAVGSDSLVGHCVNLLPIRLAMDLNQTARESIKTVQEQVFEAFDHQSYTFGSLLKKLPIERDPARPTLVSVMFNLDQALDGADLDFGGARAQILSNPRQAENFEMFLNISQTREQMSLECQYNTDLFDEATVRLWMGGLRSLLRQMATEADQPLAILDIVGQQQAQAIARLNATDTDLPPYESLGAWLSASAQTHANRTLLVTRHAESGALNSLTYQAIEERSNQLARALRQRAIGRGKTVGICLPRDERMIIAQWAVLKSGAAYVPLDPSYPAQRLAMMAQDAGIELVISLLDTVAELDLGIGEVLLLDDPTDEIATLPGTPLPASSLDAVANDPAYLIYTSGSTGRPKGVRVPHRAVVNFLGSMARKPGLTADDRLLAVTTLSFDIAVLELILPPVVGAQIVLADTETTRDGAALLALLTETETTIVQATPSTWRLLLEAGLPQDRRVKALCGGEALPPDLANSLLRHCRSVWNLYGPTETTIWSTVWRVRKPGSGIRIGRPIANTQIHVLDERAQPCPIGVPGEIVIGGAGVTLGYHDQPLLTTERFMPDSFCSEPGARLYRTGDLGRWTWTGDLEHMGRLDQQVKLRGFRIELGEIEATLQNHPAVQNAVVTTQQISADDTRLIAYLVAPDAPDEKVLRDALRKTLPEYMIPQHFIVIDEVPLLNNGKINRKALPQLESGKLNPADSAGIAPASDLERQVVQAMTHALNQSTLGTTDDFFAVGGHSILAARVISRLNDQLQIKLPMRAIFEAPTAAALAARIAAMPGSQSNTVKTDPLPVIAQADQTEGPLTPMQQRVLFVEQMSPGRVVYNVPSAHRLKGPIDLPRFTRALASVVANQPSLRTVIANADSAPIQRVLESVPVRLPLTDLTDVPAERLEITLRRKLDSLIAVPFNLVDGPLFKGAMIKMSEQEHVFFFMAHHMVWDGWSFDVLYQEMANAYSADQPSAATPPAASYIDFAHWQKQWLASDACREQVAFWVDRIARQPKTEALPSDMPRGGQRSGDGETVWIDMSDGLATRLRELASSTGTTLNMLMLAAYSLMMSDMATDKQIVIGLPMRGRERPEFESLMGFFNNLLPLHLKPQLDMPFTDWLNHVRHEVIDIFEHQSVPFERLATEIGDAGQLDYQVLFSFQEARDRSSQWGDLKHSNIPVFQRGATEDLGLWLLDGNDGLKGGITFNTDLYRRTTARALRRRFSNLLKSVARHPDMTIARLLPRMHREAPSREAVHKAAAVAPIASTATTAPVAHAEDRHAKLGDKIDFTPVSSFEDTGGEPTVAVVDAPHPTAPAGDADTGMAPGGSLPLGDTSTPENPASLGTDRLATDEPEADSLVSEARILSESAAGSEPAAPTNGRSANEQTLAEIWTKVLGLDSPDELELTDNFFDLGGTSLQAMQVMDRLEALSGIRGNPRLMVFGTLKQLASSYLGNSEAQSSPVHLASSNDSIQPTDDDPLADFKPESKPAPAAPQKGFLGRLFGGR